VQSGRQTTGHRREREEWPYGSERFYCAHAINCTTADYEDILAEIAAGEFAKTIPARGGIPAGQGGVIG
jgi:hypothetical protein